MTEIDRRSLLLNGGRLLLLGSALALGSMVAPYVTERMYEFAHGKRKELIEKVYKEENHEFIEYAIYFNSNSSLANLSRIYALRAVGDGEFLRMLTSYLEQQSPLAEGKNSALSPEAEADKFGQRFLTHFGMSDGEVKQFKNSVSDHKQLEQIMQESFKKVIDSKLAEGLGAASFQYPTEFGLGKKSASYISDGVFDFLPSSIKLYNAEDIGIADENKIRVLLRQQNFEGEIRSNGIFNIDDIDFNPLQVHKDVADFSLAVYSHARALNSFKSGGTPNPDYVLSIFYFNKSYELMLKNLELKRKNNEFTFQENRLIDAQLGNISPIHAKVKKILDIPQ